MKKFIFYTFIAISVMLMLSSTTTQSSLPGFVHEFDNNNGGILITKARYGVVVYYGDGTFTIYYYDCPPGTEFSCKAVACVPIGDTLACDCVVGQ